MTQALRDFTSKAAALTERYEKLAKDACDLLRERPRDEAVDAATAVLVNIATLYDIIHAPRTVLGPSLDYLEHWTHRMYSWTEILAAGALDERLAAAREN